MVDVEILRRERNTLAMKVTPDGVQVLIPQELDGESAEVQAFIREGLGKLELPQQVGESERLERDAVLALVDDWAERIGVNVNRVQLRRMRNKWGSISTAGNLTLTADLLGLPRHLVEYVIVHELLHLRVPHHNQLYRLLLRKHIPDFRGREIELSRWMS